jgi:hypothetical protein
LEKRRLIRGALVLDETSYLSRSFTLGSLVTPHEDFPPFPIHLKEGVKDTNDYSDFILESIQKSEGYEIYIDFVVGDGCKA